MEFAELRCRLPRGMLCLGGGILVTSFFQNQSSAAHFWSCAATEAGWGVLVMLKWVCRTDGAQARYRPKWYPVVKDYPTSRPCVALQDPVSMFQSSIAGV